jgi:hypothetical protein
LYWWHGTKKYGYQPEVLTYQEGVPEYIKNNEKFLTQKKEAGENPLIFLIHEKDDRPYFRENWVDTFREYCLIEKKEYFWGTTVEMRQKCN